MRGRVLRFSNKGLIICLLASALLANSITSAANPPCGLNVAAHLSELICPITVNPDSKIGTETAPLVIKAIPEPKSKAEIAEDNEERQERESTDFWTKVSSGLLALFTLVLAVSTSYLWLETRNLRELSTKQIELAKYSADAAVALQRPIFIIESTSISPSNGNATIKLGNHGRTPAIITKNCFVMELVDALPPQPCYPTGNIEKVDISRIVAPHDLFEISRTSVISPEDWDRVLDQKTKLWVYGYLGYIDFLKKKRRMGFCVAFDPNTPLPWSSIPVNKGNWVQVGPAAYTYDEPDT